MSDLPPVFPQVDLAPPADLTLDACADGARDNGETDIDCGGPNCAPCPYGKACEADKDCATKNCAAGKCGPMTPCKDGVRDDLETDVDCGGPACAHCAVGNLCRTDQDCMSGVCAFAHCVNPTQRKLVFGAPSVCQTGTHPKNLAVADWNGDGHPDIAAPSTTGPITVCLGRGDGTFAAPTSVPSDPTYDLWSSDFDTDGKQDIVVFFNDASGVGVLFGRGDGTFGAPIVTQTPNTLNGERISVGDLNRDGVPDVFIDVNGSSVLSLLGSRTGKFAVVKGPEDPYQAGQKSLVVDVNRDGHADVLTASQRGLEIWIGDGKGALANPVGYMWFSNGGAPESSIGTWDFGRDGILDVIDSYGDIFLGAGDGTFAQGSVVSASMPGDARGIAVVDLDRDGNVDVTVGELNDPTLHTYLGAGKGKFAQQALTSAVGGQSAYAIAVADFNGDSLPDLAVADYKGNQVSVLINRSK